MHARLLYLQAIVAVFLHGSHEGRQCCIFTRAPESVERTGTRKRSSAYMAPEHNPLELRILEAIEMCENKDAPEYPSNLLQCAEKTMEDGLRTADAVVLPNGRVVKRSIRERHAPERFAPL